MTPVIAVKPGASQNTTLLVRSSLITHIRFRC